MAVTQASLRTRVKRLLYQVLPRHNVYETTTTNSQTPSSTSVAVATGTGQYFAPGDRIEWDDGDLALVQSVSTDTLTVSRDYFDTTGTAHSSGDRISKPRFTIVEIDDAIDTVINGLWSAVYQFTTGSFTYDPSTFWYPIADTPQTYRILSLYYEDDYGKPEPIIGWQWRGQLNSTTWTESQGLVLPGPGGADSGDTLYYVGQGRINGATELLDRQEGMVAYGAAYELLGASTAGRTFDPGARTDRTVQPGQEARDSYWFLAEHERLRRMEEIALAKELEEVVPQHRRQKYALGWRL